MFRPRTGGPGDPNLAQEELDELEDDPDADVEADVRIYSVPLGMGGAHVCLDFESQGPRQASSAGNDVAADSDEGSNAGTKEANQVR